MKYCCDSFKNCHTWEKLKERARYIIFEEEDSNWYCWLITRSIDEKDLQGFSTPFPITLEAEIPLKYCPWCGKRIKRFYKKQYENYKKDSD